MLTLPVDARARIACATTAEDWEPFHYCMKLAVRFDELYHTRGFTDAILKYAWFYDGGVIIVLK